MKVQPRILIIKPLFFGSFNFFSTKLTLFKTTSGHGLLLWLI